MLYNRFSVGLMDILFDLQNGRAGGSAVAPVTYVSDGAHLHVMTSRNMVICDAM